MQGKQLAELESRFRVLSSNHNETVKFMEEHKAEKMALRKRVAALEANLETAEHSAVEALEEAHAAALRRVVAEADARVAAANADAAEARASASRLEERAAVAERERLEAVQRAVETEEKLREMSVAAMAADKIAAANKTELATLVELLKEAEAKVDRLQADLDVAKAESRALSAETAAVAQERDTMRAERDDAMRKLTEGSAGALGKLKLEYAAYKRYSSELLEKEKEVNARLRHLGRLSGAHHPPSP